MDLKNTYSTYSTYCNELRSADEKMKMGPLAPVGHPGVSLDFKSSAVVKYTSVKFPVQFSTIRLDTDLNHPPSDRYRSGYFMFSDHHMRPGPSKFSDFLSLNLADTYKDLVGKVDVISSSKNIKDLLKMPYSNSPHISIMVHRVSKTVLLEEFDVHKNLIKMQAEEWSWLKKYYENVIAKGQEDKTKWLVSANQKRDSFTENMYMNLLRHSFAASVGGKDCTALETAEDKSRQVHHIPDSSDDLKGFHHETLWKFEDISMLIDSDLPIFGSGETPRPCISLRLRDARSPPINILTGLDYWLDNLMSNVPEVAMCYHVNGIVKKYEVMRTEDIPNLENSRFDPNEVLDIAQNIMSFIRRNAAVEGHTYWLYKSENDDMVKLYDLTDYCKNEISEGDNPFTVPVGLLCHRVGTNLKRSGQRRMADARAMFENCLRLLDETKHAQICAEAHFHLSDMWVPDKSVHDVWQEKGKISEPPSDLYDEDENSSDENNGQEPKARTHRDHLSVDNVKAIKGENKSYLEKFPEGEEIKNSVALKELVVRGMVKKKAWEVIQACRIAGTTDERCKMALSHIRKGLNCVDKDLPRGKNIGLVEKQQTCSPSKAIPLFYKPLNLYRKVNTHDTESDSDTKDEISSESDKKEDISSGSDRKEDISSGSDRKEDISSGSDRKEDISSVSDRKEDISSGSESEPRMSDTFSAIPLHYKMESQDKDNTLSGSIGHLTLKVTLTNEVLENADDELSSSLDEENDGKFHSKTWHDQAKFQLLRKAAITYFVLAKEFFEIKKYGHTLRHLRYAIHCYESIELINKSVRNENQDKELYLMLLYLAAKARCCISSNWPQCHRDFEDLGEEEAAILHSAQALLATPKNSWIYEWPISQESNMLAANDLYEIASKLLVLDKKPAGFKVEMKKNHAACILNLGNTQMEICKEKVITNKETYEAIKAVWDKSMRNYLKAISMFESVNDKNTAGYICSNVAYLHVLAAAAINNSNTQVTLTPSEKDHLQKSIEWYEEGLSKYERGEAMDDARENVYHNMRMQYQEMALRYFRIPSGKVTEQDLRTMKELIQKSLSYCFLDSGGKHLKKSQICAGLNHLNLARIFDVESVNCTNAARKRNLKQKMEESFQKSFDIYGLIKWRRSQMCVKFCWIDTLLEETKTLTVQAKKKIVRAVFSHLCDLTAPLVALNFNDYDGEDSMDIYSTNFSAVKKLLLILNGAFCSFLKMESTNIAVKKLYERSLRLTSLTEMEHLQQPLVNILTDLKTLLATEALH
uniref:Erythroid differentiation-related factor 1 n=1 Tax=Biomphalaria glabrata TaxID=6526 RepID=A0A2C9M859_BIOGL